MKNKTHCTECDNKEAFELKPIARYQYKLSGLPNVFLKGVLQGTCPQCGAVSVSIPRPQQLSRVIRDVLIKKSGMLTGAEIRYLRKSIGFDQQQMADMLKVSRETISRMESDSVEPSDKMDLTIRLAVKDKERNADYSLIDLISAENLIKMDKGLNLEVKGTDWAIAA
jgi:putative zinc finger/helix-turn-helix YgiT family protein